MRSHCGVGARGGGLEGAVQGKRGARVAVDGLPRHRGGRVRLLRVRHLCEDYVFISIYFIFFIKIQKKNPSVLKKILGKHALDSIQI